MKLKKIDFRKQFPVLKLIFIFVNILAVISFKDFHYIVILNLLYFLPSPTIFLEWAKTLMKILPFFISYFLIGLFLEIKIYEQIDFSLKISFYLLLSVYLIKTTDYHSVIRTLKPICKIRIFRILTFFIAAVMNFISYFILQYKTRNKKINTVNSIVEIFSDSFNKIDYIEYKTEKSIVKAKPLKYKNSFSNNYAIFFIIVTFIINFI